ncbi:MAG: ATP-binding protein [Thermoanaerobaculaceae bacterium]|jgi:signal transduction histidine kinase
MPDQSEPGLENLVNQIAHDVRNHAFTISLQAEMGQRRSAGSPEVKAHFDTILHQVDALGRYLDTLLLFGRPVKLAPATVDPIALVNENIEAAQYAKTSEATAQIRVETAGVIRQTCWDARAIGHALRAVLDNAIRSATPPPAILIHLRGAEDHIAIEVRDGGQGISADVLPKLGVPMAVRRPGAPGLGLAIARKMVEAHGGRLEIESAGSGTTVRFILPWAAPDSAA